MPIPTNNQWKIAVGGTYVVEVFELIRSYSSNIYSEGSEAITNVDAIISTYCHCVYRIIEINLDTGLVCK